MPSPNSTDAGLESTFANLAFARLKDKAPGLLDYLIGFQLIDKNEDETHAIGVFGFNVGDEWVYAPVFFINGELKGHELMYVKSQDAFVPMTEEWVNYILNRKPSLLGEVERRPRGELGLRQPDFDLFARAPFIGSKYASAHRNFAQICEMLTKSAVKNKDGFDFTPFMEVFITGPEDERFSKLASSMDLRGAIKLLGKQAARNLLHTMKENENFADAVLQYYKLEDLIGAADSIKEAMPDDLMVVDPKLPVVVITRGDDASRLEAFMDEEDKKKLLKNQYVVKDERSDDQKTRLYKSQIGMSLTNPMENGYYEIVTSKGLKQNAIVITTPKSVDGFNRKEHCVVIEPTTKKYGNYYAGDVYVSKQFEKGEWQKVFDKLPSLNSLSENDIGIFVGPDCQGTVAFRVEKKWNNADGNAEMRVVPYNYINNEASSRFRPKRWEDQSVHMAYPCPNDMTILITDNPGYMESIGNTIFIPSNYKAIKMDKSPKYSMGGTMDLGTLEDVTMRLFKTASEGGAGIESFRVLTDAIAFTLEFNGRPGPRMSKVAAIKSLILDHGFGEDDALLVLGAAKPRNAETYYVKRAYDGQGMEAPQFTEPQYGQTYGLNTRSVYPQSEAQNISGNSTMMNRQYYRDDRSLDDNARQYSQQAARTGQKEILDTAVISGLVKSTDTDGRVDSYIADLLLGLDRIGRILFMYYWHNDKFRERYGQQDLQQLEDNLRNVFKQLGEVTLYLKAKTIEPDKADSAEADLSTVMS